MLQNEKFKVTSVMISEHFENLIDEFRRYLPDVVNEDTYLLIRNPYRYEVNSGVATSEGTWRPEANLNFAPPPQKKNS